MPFITIADGPNKGEHEYDEKCQQFKDAEEIFFYIGLGGNFGGIKHIYKNKDGVFYFTHSEVIKPTHAI